MAWMTAHRNENPYPCRHHATNIFRTGTEGEATMVRFYLYVNQITNNVPFAEHAAKTAASSGQPA